jgi:hypothetical protein
VTHCVELELQKPLHVFSYLKTHENSKLVFDPCPQVWGKTKFKRSVWSDFYCDTKEPIPPNAPSPRGHLIQILQGDCIQEF